MKMRPATMSSLVLAILLCVPVVTIAVAERAAEPAPDGGFETFCTAKETYACGVPAISATGVPSASATSGFIVRAEQARSCRAGILLYNDALAADPRNFFGGTLCVESMGLRRAGPTNSMGSVGSLSCDGAFTIDMNTFASGKWQVPGCDGKPLGILACTPASYLATPGTTVHAQFWGRDFPQASGSFVSDGLTWTVEP